MLGTCTGYFCFKKIGLVALAMKISNSMICELRQNSMHFVRKSDGLNFQLWQFTGAVRHEFKEEKNCSAYLKPINSDF